MESQPVEVLELIISYCNITEVIQLIRTCKRFAQIIPGLVIELKSPNLRYIPLQIITRFPRLVKTSNLILTPQLTFWDKLRFWRKVDHKIAQDCIDITVTVLTKQILLKKKGVYRVLFSKECSGLIIDHDSKFIAITTVFNFSRITSVSKLLAELTNLRGYSFWLPSCLLQIKEGVLQISTPTFLKLVRVKVNLIKDLKLTIPLNAPEKELIDYCLDKYQMTCLEFFELNDRINYKLDINQLTDFISVKLTQLPPDQLVDQIKQIYYRYISICVY